MWDRGYVRTFSFKRASETGLLGRAATGGGEIEVSGILRLLRRMLLSA
jgi:hypothetical protein